MEGLGIEFLVRITNVTFGIVDVVARPEPNVASLASLSYIAFRLYGVRLSSVIKSNYM